MEFLLTGHVDGLTTKRMQGSRLDNMKKIVLPLNPMPDGSCRTVKAQYQQTSLANFIRRGGYDTMIVAVMEIEYEDLQDVSVSERSE